MRWYILFSLSFFISNSIQARETDSLFLKLETHIAKRNQYIQKKNQSIAKLVLASRTEKGEVESNLLFSVYEQLVNEYEAYNFDSALHYSTKWLNLAYQLNDPIKIALVKSKTGNILTARGLYREAIDTLLSVSAVVLPTDEKALHYGYLARAYYDVADFNSTAVFSPNYRKLAEKYIDSIQILLPSETFYPLWFEGLRYLARYDLNKSVVYLEKILSDLNPSHRQLAGVHSALGYIYREYNQPEQALYHAIESAIYDMMTATKETMALTSLAEQLYYEGDIERAYRYILLAKEDADIFNAKLRQLHIASLLPKIEAAQLHLIEKKRKLMVQSILLVGSVMLLISTLALIALIQLRRLRKARKIILQTNTDLLELTEKLHEANKIKTEYIGYYFKFSTQYIDKLEGLHSVINSFLAQKNFAGIERSINSLNPKTERDKLFKNFDSYFLNIFPEFVEKFNELMLPEEQVIPDEPKTLNNDLRIFALLRLGISDNEQIARILGFSVNTVYTYKTRIKKKARVSSSDFENKIMEIRFA